MGEVEENRGREHVTMQMNSFPRDLFQGFVSGSHFLGKFQGRADDGAEDKDEDIELTLGLSLNGRFGVDPERAKKLTRSSSISNLMISNDHNKACMGGGAYVPLTRTCSLPTETEEEWRKRKELQSLRRMEAKRKRMEKLKNVRVVRDKVDLEENGEFNGGQGLVTHNGNGFGVPPQLLSQRSGASVVFDLDCQLIKDPESGSPSSVHSLPGRTEQIAKAIPVASNGRISTAGMENPSINLTDGADKEAKQMLRNVMIDMPCVSTKGYGPNGKRIEGFLYRYRKGEEARIVCVCHGSFLSPAEFVRHAGGGDVAHPLKHIVVNPSPFL